MAAVIVWIFMGVVVYLLLHGFPASPEKAHKNQWKLKHLWQRVLARLSMLLAGPVWMVIILLSVVITGCSWVYTSFCRSLLK